MCDLLTTVCVSSLLLRKRLYVCALYYSKRLYIRRLYVCPLYYSENVYMCVLFTTPKRLYIRPHTPKIRVLILIQGVSDR